MKLCSDSSFFFGKILIKIMKERKTQKGREREKIRFNFGYFNRIFNTQAEKFAKK